MTGSSCFEVSGIITSYVGVCKLIVASLFILVVYSICETLLIDVYPPVSICKNSNRGSVTWTSNCRMTVLTLSCARVLCPYFLLVAAVGLSGLVCLVLSILYVYV